MFFARRQGFLSVASLYSGCCQTAADRRAHPEYLPKSNSEIAIAARQALSSAILRTVRGGGIALVVRWRSSFCIDPGNPD
jgi:hypothetical protein